MRAVAIAVVVALVAAACGSREVPRASSGPAEPVRSEAGAARSKWRAKATPPGLRLPDTVTPLGYKLRIEVDPATPTFRGHVDIRARVNVGIDTIWLHARDLTITRALLRVGNAASERMQRAPERGDEMIGFEVGHMVYPGEVTLAFDYEGAIRSDTNGLFRQQADGKWFAYTQGQAVFTRLFVPCFDEPRFKTPWQVSLVVPGDQIAVSNAPVATEQVLADGRKEVTFEELGPLPSYLVAFAVGPFAIVDGGTVGAATPFRVAVWPSGVARVKHAAPRVSKMLAAFEDYFGQRMPWPKLDFVAVPSFFGAMENVGVVTFDARILFDESDGEYGFARVAAHELAHQWFGNLVTPAWWDELWLSEAFASFLGDKIAELAGETKDAMLVQQLARGEALVADAAVSPQPLRREIQANGSVDDTFDEIAYQKGASVLAMFEGYLDAERFRGVLRDVVRAHAKGTVTTETIVGALRAIDPRAADALASYATRAGTPVVDLGLVCDAPTKRVIATARDGAVVPVCVRYPGAGGPTRACAVVSARTEIPLAATVCPAWIAGNANGTGYYEVVSTAPRAIDKLLPAERMALGGDAATAITRGQVRAAEAITLANALFASTDPYARLGAVAIARALDPIVDDATRPAWTAWLAKRLREQLGAARSAKPIARELLIAASQLVPAAQFDRGYLRAAVAEAERGLGRKEPDAALPSRAASVLGGTKLFDRIVTVARARPAVEQRDYYANLGDFGADMAPRIIDVLLDPATRGSLVVGALVQQLERAETRTAAWRALHARLAAVSARVTPADLHDIVTATSGLCDAKVRGEVASAFEPRIGDVPDGKTVLALALASIDRCITRARAAGDLKPMLRAP